MADPFRVFYREHTPDLSVITGISFRHFRFLLPCGTFLKVPDRIRDGRTLQGWLVRYRPSDVYYSTSYWLAPEKIGRREGTPLSQNIFLSSDIVFDIDRTPFSHESLDSARNDTLRLVAFCVENNLPVRYIAFSGCKGFHVVCSDTVRYADPDPLAREDAAKERRKEILARVLEERITVDTKITPDTRRIIRVPGTINGKTGYLCTVISEKELQQPAREILKYVPRAMECTPSIPHAGDEISLRVFRIIPWLCHRFGVRSKPEHPVSYATFLVNTVPGTTLQVPFFCYPPWRTIETMEDELRRLQATYGLSDIYLFRSGTGFAAICLRTFPLRRLEKILKKSSSVSTGTLLKYHQIFLRVGTSRDASGNICADSPRFVKTIPAGPAGNAHYVSLPHHRFLSDFIPLPVYPRMHGSGAVTLTHTVTEDT